MSEDILVMKTPEQRIEEFARDFMDVMHKHKADINIEGPDWDWYITIGDYPDTVYFYTSTLDGYEVSGTTGRDSKYLYFKNENILKEE